jgi:hypothetical protein
MSGSKPKWTEVRCTNPIWVEGGSPTATRAVSLCLSTAPVRHMSLRRRPACQPYGALPLAVGDVLRGGLL